MGFRGTTRQRTRAAQASRTLDYQPSAFRNGEDTGPADPLETQRMKAAGDGNTPTPQPGDAENEFGEAFSEASKDGAKPDQKTVETPTDDTGNQPTGDTGSDLEKGQELGNPAPATDQPAQASGEPETPSGVEPDKGQPSDEPWEHKYKSLDGKYRKETQRRQQLEQEIEEMRRQLAAKAEPQDTDATPKGKQAGDPDDEDAQLLQELDEDMPLMGKAVRRMLEKQQQKLQEIEQRFQPVAATVQKSAVEKHFTMIRAEHNDFDEIMGSGAVQEWVDSHPDYIRTGMQKVIKEGDAQEVIDLINRYKKENGIGQEKPADQQQQDDAAARRRARQIEEAEAVRTRTAPNVPKGQADKDDFEGAFDEAARVT